jgi:hypothetical protein
MKKTIVFLTLIAVLLLAACTTPATTAPATQAPATAAPATAAPATAAPAAPVTITFWSWVPNIKDQVDEWNAAHPEIQVNYVNAGNGNTEYTKLNTAIQANADIPDVVQIEYQHLPGYIAQDVLLDLTKYGANDVKSQFIPWTWSQVSQGTGVYAFPQDAGPMVMFCNDAVLQKYNIAVPTTWDEFATAAAALHKADPKVYLSTFTADQGWFFGMQIGCCLGKFIPGGRDFDIVLLKHGIVAEHDHGAGILREGIDSSSLGDLGPGPGNELALDVVRSVLGQIGQRALSNVARQMLVLDLDDIRDVGVGLQGGIELGVFCIAIAGVNVVNLDLGVQRIPFINLVLDIGHPRPEVDGNRGSGGGCRSWCGRGRRGGCRGGRCGCNSRRRDGGGRSTR